MQPICFFAWLLILTLFNIGILGTNLSVPRILFLCASGIVFFVFFYIRYTRIDDRAGSLLGNLFLVALVISQILYVVAYLVFYYVVSAIQDSPEDTWWSKNHKEVMQCVCNIMVIPYIIVWFALLFQTRKVLKKFVGHLRWLVILGLVLIPYFGFILIAPYRNDPYMGISGKYEFFSLTRFIAIVGSFVITVWCLWMSLLIQDPQYQHEIRDFLSLVCQRFLVIFSRTVVQAIPPQCGHEMRVTIPPQVAIASTLNDPIELHCSPLGEPKTSLSEL